MGLGDTIDRSIFTQVNISNVEQVSCGSNHTMILKNDGTLWACGTNNSYQLGLGNDQSVRLSFVQVDVSDVKHVSCGNAHTFILKHDGTLWSCGNNGNGQLGLGDTTTRSTFTQVNVSDAKQITCGGYFTFILKNDGTLWSSGYNRYGQLGLGDTIDRSIFTQINISDINQISCGNSHVLILKNDGTLWSCGYNGNGQLGLGDTTTRSTFTQVEVSDVIYLFDNITLSFDSPKYKLINIMDYSNITSADNKYLITLPYRCKVFKYTISTTSTIYYTMDNTLTINSDTSEWSLDNSYTASAIKNINLKKSYICTQVLIEADNIDDLQIWAEYDDGSISIGKITNEKLSELSQDIKNNLYITEDRYVYTNDMNGNYFRLNSICQQVLFEGSIIEIGDNNIDGLINYHIIVIVSKDNTDNYYNDIVCSNVSNLKLSHNDNHIIININDDIINLSEVNGLTITSIYGLQ